MAGARKSPRGRGPARRGGADAREPVVLVTGASQGIGAAVARAFALSVPRCRMALVSRNEAKLKAVARSCGGRGRSGLNEIFLCDVTDAVAVESLAAAVRRRFGAVDVLVNNAGVFAGAPFLETAVEDFDRIVAASLASTFLVSKAFVPDMVRSGRGDVFNLSSIAGLHAYPGGAAYCSAKFAVTGLTKVMRQELKGHGIRVCCVHPGATFTPSWEGAGIPEERMMPAEDVARAIVSAYLASRRTVVEEIVLRPQAGDV